MHEFIHRIPHSPWKKPSQNEQEYFRRQELELRARNAQRKQRERERRERERLAETHRNHCPSCGISLEPMPLANAEAKRCPECRGVWLDQEVFESVIPRKDRDEALGEMFRAMMRFSLGRIPEMVERSGEDEGRGASAH